MKFYKCELCGNLIEMVNDSGVPIVCCGQDMTEIIPGTSDGAHEKHVPVYSVADNKITVNVGSVAHPMLAEHYIEWVAIETDKGAYRIALKPGSEPKVEHKLLDDENVVNVYAYCNLHGLWKAK